MLNMANHLYFSVLVFSVVWRYYARVHAEYTGVQPSLVSKDGHLVLVTGSDKNISLETRGSGYVNINGQNIVLIAKMAVNASETVERLRVTKLVALETTVASLSSALEGPRGMKRRMTNVEAALNNGTMLVVNGGGGGGAGRGNRARFQLLLLPLTRRLTALESAVRDLKALLTTNECASNPCRNGATCEDSYNGFYCRCPTNWEGVLCERDVNECAMFAGTDLGCQNNARCTNKPGTYECACQDGWFGVHCAQRSNDCSAGSSRDLCDHGICVSQSGSTGYTCICDQGWQTNGLTKICSTDKDECAGKRHRCSVNPFVRCNNIPGSYFCDSCPPGYSGNGYHCIDIDECTDNNGGCSSLVQCTNTLGSRVCGSCPPGYQGDGITCMHSSGACANNNGGCNRWAVCTDNAAISSTYVQCRCKSGYVGSGVGDDGCAPGGETTPRDACLSNPCQRGSCVRNGPAFTCKCPPGYAGRMCERRVNGCMDSPCLNGGACTDLNDGAFRCNCTAGFTGPTCEETKQSCGGVIRTQTGSIKYPLSLSQRYDHSVSCAWMIKVNESQVLNVTFKSFDLESSTECTFDWLQIHDGTSAGARQIGRYCGNTLPNKGNIVTTNNAIYLWFRSDAAVSRDGFELTWNATLPVCGGVIETSSFGTLSSPGSPGRYPPNRDCYWSIKAPLQKRIQFQFYTLMIQSEGNCSGDYLAIHDGLKRNDPVLKQFCSTIHPPPLVTPGPFATVHFHSDAQGSDTGFQLTYSVVEGFPGCGGVLTAPKGDIVSPRDPTTNKYRNAIDCGWLIQQPENQRIKISFVSFQLEESRTCAMDYVEIREGTDESAPLVKRYCGTSLPRNYESAGNVLFIRFRTDFSLTREGFHIKYITMCGGDFSTPEGILTSPNYPDPYPDSRTCVYRIVQPTGKAIKLHFLDFDVEDNSYPQCNFDYLQVRDGDNENSTLIGQYCGGKDKTPPDAISTHNYMWLQFNTDSFVRNKGFQANYSTIDTQCGGILRDTHGIINSPSHPETYPHNIHCSWVIVAQPGHVIQLTFITFSLENHPTCRRDYVEIFDNSTATNTGVSMGKYCGGQKPPVLTSSDTMINVLFVTDSSVTREGFTATYIIMDSAKLCGGNFYTTKGWIQSPNYPGDYLHEKDCTWIVQVPQGQQIMLNVTDFKLELHSLCNFDFVEIRNGGFKTSPLIGKFCGDTIPRQIPSLGNQIYVRFVSDSSRAAKGFRIQWDGTATGCGGTLTAPTGSITSPNYPAPYGRNGECFWRISVSAGSTITLVIIDFELEIHSKCKMDYLQIHDGSDMNAKMIGRYCSTHPTTITSKTNHMYLKFRSDLSQEGRGFHLKYVTKCTTDITGNHGVIESPNFPTSYPGDIDCTWHIAAPPGNKVNITFSHFDTEVQPEMTAAKQRQNPGQKVEPCDYDYLQITESDKPLQEPKDRIIGRYCGNDLPDPIWSSEAHVFVHFQSDALVAGIGFRLEWVLNGCGGLLEKAGGTFTSPGYPNTYKTSLTCEWQLNVDFDKSIQINFTDINLERNKEDCRFDSVQVYNGEDDTGVLLGKYCHSVTKPVILTTTGNQMYVKFVSDWSYSGRGFTATYMSKDSVCGGLMTAPKGVVHSRNYPNNYGANDDCQWLIEVDSNHVISLTFLEFDVEYHNNCTMDYVRVFDGDSKDAPKLLDHCGSNLPEPVTYVSTTNKVFIHFKSDGSVAAKGFKANYSIACGARIVTEDTGILTIIDALNAADNTNNCSWVIVGKKPDDRVRLTVTHMDVSAAADADTDCDMYYLEVLDGESLDSPRIGGQYCGNRAPAQLTSSGSAMVVHLVALHGRHYGVFTATYSVLSSACGGNLTSERGAFATPNYPSNYPLNAECVWEIVASPGNRAQLSFSTFNIATSEYCNDDYVEVREGGALGKLVGVYCDGIPANLTAANRLWIKFRSGSEGEGSGGFTASYTLLHGNKDLSGPQGQIANPLYPHPYIQEARFEWRITVQFGYAISVTFTEFYVDSRVPACPMHMTIFDGFDGSAPELLKACGGILPEPVTSSSNVVFLQLNADPMRQGTIFFLNWLQVVKNKPIKLIDNQDNTTCGGTIDMKHKTGPPDNYELTSPGYPEGYGGRLNCEWIFETNPGFHLAFTATDIDLESNPACAYDNVQIFRGRRNQAEWRPVKTICLTNQTKDGAIQASSSLMKVLFHTDAYVNRTGFSAIVQSVCGGLLLDVNGAIEVTNMTRHTGSLQPRDRGFRPNVDITDCQWNITVKPGRKISLKFTRMALPNATAAAGCGDDYVILKNGGSADSPVLGDGKYCGNSLPSAMETSGNRAYIRYLSQVRLQKGFRLEYREIGHACGGNVILNIDNNATNISSPNYPNIPSPHSECSWTIMAPAGEKLKITFIERFDLSKTADCSTAGVEIRDGGTQTSRMLGTYCLTKPSSLETTGNIVYIRFFTDVDDPKNGFKATVEISRCGGVMRDKTGYVTSPNSPGSYPNKIDCEWRIVGPPGHTINLDLQTLDLPRSSSTANCTGDYVMLAEPIMGNQTAETVLGMFCNGTKAFARSSSNEVIVRFHSNTTEATRMGRSYTGFKLFFNASLDVCGGELSTPSGTIESPGYPNPAPNRVCRWTITVPKGRRVTLKFLDFDFDGDAATGSRLSFYHDDKYNARIMAFNATTPPQTVQSSMNLMFVSLWMQKITGHRGFKASYNSDELEACGGSITNMTQGVIIAPDVNLTSYVCEWESIRPEQTNETLTFTLIRGNIGTRDVSKCEWSQSQVAVSTDDNKRLDTLCGNYTEPYIVRSPFPITKLKAMEGKYHGDVDFLVKYKTSPCGGVLGANSDVISSPGYPGNYPFNTDCAWVGTFSLETPHWYKINFTKMDIASSPNCEKDYLIIRNGPLPTSPHLGRYCGNTLPREIQTQNNFIWIDFHTGDAPQGGTGFSLTLTPVTSGCGGVFHRNEGSVRTPRFPQQYPENTECEWEVRVQPGYTVHLSFVERFFLEESDKCSKDFAEVFDYVGDDWRSLGRVCGRTTPPTFNSTHGRMKLLFRSDNSGNSDGFKAMWNVSCGGIIEGQSRGQIISPNYPDTYAGNLNCNYTIVAPNQHISVSFETFRLEAGPKECVYDNVTLWGLAHAWSRTPTARGTYCGSDVPPSAVFKNQVSLVFMTDTYVARQGFLMRYELTSCGGELNRPGALVSPRERSGFMGTLNCTWTITAPANQVVVLRMDRLELEHSYKCHYDSVTVFEGPVADASQLLGTFCGNLSAEPPVIKSTTNQMAVILNIAHQNPRYTFEASAGFTYGEKVGCGGSRNLTSTPITLSSPDVNRDGQYDAFLDCHWLLLAPAGHTVSLNFKKMEMAACFRANVTANCTCDYIEVRDGNSQVADLIGRFCNVLPVVPLISSGNAMWIRLVTDDTVNAAGFIAEAVTMPSLCGNQMLNVTNSSQVLQSPNYPNNYPNNLRCRWLLTTEGNLRFDIKILDLDIDETADCSGDSLTLNDVGRFPLISSGTGRGVLQFGTPERQMSVFRGSRNPSAPSTFCGRSNTMDYYSESNNLEVTFVTDAERSSKGFKLTYQVTGCTRNFTGVQGRIFVERIPERCYITVLAPANTTIALYFSSFQIFSMDCKSKALQIHDGEDGNAPVLAKYCGHEPQNPVFSTGNKVYLHAWRSDGSDYEHFDITYTSTDKGRGCGGQIFNYGGVFTSPLYPTNVRNASVCRWDVSVPTGTLPVLKFATFDIGPKSTCETDFLEIFDIDDEGVEIPRTRLCGEDEPALYMGETETFGVRYTTSVHNGGTGWMAKFMGRRPGAKIANF